MKVLLALITQDNDYQREQAIVAEAAARRLGIELEVVYASNDAVAQTRQLLASLSLPQADRPRAVIVEPVGTGMLAVAQAAIGHGIGWIVLNREADYLAPLRQQATVPVGSIDCDNIEVGRIQGRQFGALLPGGGKVLYVEGPGGDACKQRRAGLEETLPAGIELLTIRGKWTEESGQQAVAQRLRGLASRAPSIGLIGCQNDAMALGAWKALAALPPGPHREAWLKVPLTGVDGVRTSGQVAVVRGLLKATVVVSALTEMALELLVKSLATGEQIPERTLTRPVSYPRLEELR